MDRQGFVCQFLNTNQSIPNHFKVVPLDLVLPTSTVFVKTHGLTWDPQPQIMRSADMERGFPMPKGCYYKGYPTGNRREVWVWRVGGLEVVKIAILAKPWNYSSLRPLSREHMRSLVRSTWSFQMAIFPTKWRENIENEQLGGSLSTCQLYTVLDIPPPRMPVTTSITTVLVGNP